MKRRRLLRAMNTADDYATGQVLWGLAEAYRAVVEVQAYRPRMDEEVLEDRLASIRECLEEALKALVGSGQVKAWEAEARSPSYSPFAG